MILLYIFVASENITTHLNYLYYNDFVSTSSRNELMWLSFNCKCVYIVNCKKHIKHKHEKSISQLDYSLVLNFLMFITLYNIDVTFCET